MYLNSVCYLDLTSDISSVKGSSVIFSTPITTNVASIYELLHNNNKKNIVL